MARSLKDILNSEFALDLVSKIQEAQLLENARRRSAIEQLIKRGSGWASLHYPPEPDPEPDVIVTTKGK